MVTDFGVAPRARIRWDHFLRFGHGKDGAHGLRERFFDTVV